MEKNRAPICIIFSQAVIMILDSNHSHEVKEQALCIVANIADGDSAKYFIMNSETILKKLIDYMVNEKRSLVKNFSTSRRRNANDSKYFDLVIQLLCILKRTT